MSWGGSKEKGKGEGGGRRTGEKLGGAESSWKDMKI